MATVAGQLTLYSAVDFSSIQQQIARANTEQINFNISIENGAKASEGLLDKFIDLASSKINFDIGDIVNLSDEMATTKARLESVVDEFNTVEGLQQKIYHSAERSRASYVDTANTISKMGTMAEDAFSGNDEIIAFTELLNKQFVISGTSAQGVRSIMSQLTESMAQGVLSASDLNSVFSEAPSIVQTLADYMGVGIEEVSKLADEGRITANVFKNAMFNATEEINGAFGNMPMTWSQIWISVVNEVIRISEPLLEFINLLAKNWDTLKPIVLGVAVAIGVYTAAIWIAEQANNGLIASMKANPLGILAIVIGVIIGLIYSWVQSVGGIQIAWQIVVNEILTALDKLKIGFFTGFYGLIDLLSNLHLKFMNFSFGIQNYLGDMKVGVLNILQDMVNSAIDIINKFIGYINEIPGISIETIEHVTFGTNAELKNEAEKRQRETMLNNFKSRVESGTASREAALEQMKFNAKVAAAKRQLEINAARIKMSEEIDPASFVNDDISNIANSAQNISENTGNLRDSFEVSEEDIQYLRDIAEREVIDRTVLRDVKLEVSNSFGDIRETADVDGIITRIEDRLSEAIESEAEGDYNV